MQGTRLVREILGVAHKKPKGKDELAPEADDPPWPDVKVVVIVNKRSGSRVVRTPSKSNAARIGGGGAEPARDLSFFASQPRRNACRKHIFLRGARVSRAVTSDARQKARPLTPPDLRIASHRADNSRVSSWRCAHVPERDPTGPVASPPEAAIFRQRRVFVHRDPNDVSPMRLFFARPLSRRFLFFSRNPKLALLSARASLLPSCSFFAHARRRPSTSPDPTRRSAA